MLTPTGHRSRYGPQRTQLTASTAATPRYPQGRRETPADAPTPLKRSMQLPLRRSALQREVNFRFEIQPAAHVHERVWTMCIVVLVIGSSNKDEEVTLAQRAPYARRMGQPTQRVTNYTARSNIEPAQIFLHANGQNVPRSGGARDVGRGAGSHRPSTASESFSHLWSDPRASLSVQLHHSPRRVFGF